MPRSRRSIVRHRQGLKRGGSTGSASAMLCRKMPRRAHDKNRSLMEGLEHAWKPRVVTISPNEDKSARLLGRSLPHDQLHGRRMDSDETVSCGYAAMAYVDPSWGSAIVGPSSCTASWAQLAVLRAQRQSATCCESD